MTKIQTIINIHNSIFEAFPEADKITENNITFPYLEGFYNDPSMFELWCNNESSRYKLTNELFQEITQYSIQQYNNLLDEMYTISQ